jgi:hypothetical protein
MSDDLEPILRDWPHESGKVKVRKIIGRDGRMKVQLRLDLGVIQMNLEGRPDGERPHGFESLLAYQQHLAEQAETAGEPFHLTADDCGDLQQEGIQYYHRYVSLFHLHDYPSVVRDTERNLALIDFVAEFAEGDDIVESFEQFRPYVLMIRTRAKASMLLDEGDLDGALREVAAGREQILEAYLLLGKEDAEEPCPEVVHLDEWAEELRTQQPVSRVDRLRRELQAAIDDEAYERAAEIRDAIRSAAAEETAPDAR